MKLRFRSNSIRLRLGQSEVRRLDLDGAVRETIRFGSLPQQHLTYILYSSSEGSNVAARIEGGQVLVAAPRDAIHHWAASDEIGIVAVQHIFGQPDLKIFIEKDFACIDAPPSESQEDAFANPQLIGAACAVPLKD